VSEGRHGLWILPGAGQVPLQQLELATGLPTPAPARGGLQPVSPGGQTRPGLDELLAERPDLMARHEQLVCRAGGPRACHYWLGSINGDTGHGELHLRYDTGLDGARRAWVEYAHRIAFVRDWGPLNPGESVRHGCDEYSCCNGAHLVAGAGSSQNTRDWWQRRNDWGNPLTDRRGPQGRAVAIRNAILTAGPDPARQWAAASAAAAEGLPPWRQPDLFG
jgi:hypothetical protein